MKEHETADRGYDEACIIEELTCIVCPRSCVITVERDPDTGDILAIENARCQRGTAWVTREILDPVRTVCSSVRVTGGTEPLAGVKTDRPVPRKHIEAVMEAVRNITVPAPVHIGEVVLEYTGETVCRIVITRSVAAG